MKAIFLSLLLLLAGSAAYAQQSERSISGPAHISTLHPDMSALWKTLQHYQDGDTSLRNEMPLLLQQVKGIAATPGLAPALRMEASCIAANIYMTNELLNRDSCIAYVRTADKIYFRNSASQEARACYPMVMQLLAYAAYIKGQKDEATEIALRTLDSLKKYPSPKVQYKTYRSLGTFNNRSGNGNKAYDYFGKAAAIATSIGDFYPAKDLMLNQVEAMIVTDSLPFNSTYQQRCITLFSRIDAFCLQHKLQKQKLYYSMKGRMYHALGQFRLEISYEDSAIREAGNNISPNAMARHYYAKGRAYFELGEMKKARENLDKIKLSYFDPNAVVSTLSYKHRVYAALGDSAGAYAALLELKRIFDSTGLIELNQRVTAISKKYDVAQKDVEIARLETSEVRNRAKMIVAVAVFVLICIIYYFIYRRSKARLQASLQKIEDLTEMQLFRIQEAAAQAKEEERIRIGMNLHDNLASTISAAGNFIRNQSERIANADESHKWALIANALSNAYESVRSQSHELYNQAQGKDTFIEMIRQNVLLYFSGTGIKTEIRIDEPSLNFLPAPLKVCIIYIIKEAATNILKHARATLVEVLIYLEEGVLVMAVSDNGKGMGARIKGGIGIETLYKRVHDEKGKMQIHSSEKGTEIEVKFPITEAYQN